jgi:hypothetical protein
MKQLIPRFYTTVFAMTMAVTAASVLAAQDGPFHAEPWASDSGKSDKSTSLTELYRLQGAFHREASVHDPVNGDAEDVINQRVVAMLALWTEDGWVWLDVGGSRDGYYQGKGSLSDPSACPPPSTSYGNRGTLCTFFKYVAGSFQAANKFVSLAPSYKTQFHVRGLSSTVYFECHYFNVVMDADTGRPLWAPASHVVFDGGARLIEGRWRLSYAHLPAAGVPIP